MMIIILSYRPQSEAKEGKASVKFENPGGLYSNLIQTLYKLMSPLNIYIFTILSIFLPFNYIPKMYTVKPV